MSYPDPAWTNDRAILCAMTDLNDSISWWRGWGPLCHLAKNTARLDVNGFDFMQQRAARWDMIEAASCTFMSRPSLPEHRTMLNMTMSAGRPTWVDLDDNYWEIPEWNWAWSFFNGPNEGAKERLKDSINQARVLTVSTQPIADYIRDRIAPDADPIVVPNALPDWFEWATGKRQKIVLYRGTARHGGGDLFGVSAELQAVMDENPSWTFVFCGGHPIVLRGANLRWRPEMPLNDFHRWLQILAPAVVIKPLEFTLFNECKSNIAWMEATYGGAVALCPDLPVYREDGCVTYQPGQFGARLRELLAAPQADRAAFVVRSQATIDAKYRLFDVNRQRYAIASRLINSAPSLGGARSPSDRQTACPASA